MTINKANVVDMYVTHLGTKVVESIEVDEHGVILYTTDTEDSLKNQEVPELEFASDFGSEQVYDWNDKR